MQNYKKSMDNRRLIIAKEPFLSEKPLMGREGDSGSDYAEHVIVCAHRVVIHEQVASEGFIVEVA